MAKTKMFKYYSDSGHGWLAVKLTVLAELGLTDRITGSSYVKGKTAYLEEDGDLFTFKNAYETVYGTLVTKEVDHGDRSWVRNLQPYGTVAVSVPVSVEVQATDEDLSARLDQVNAPDFQE